VRTIAVYSTADRHAPFVREADAAVAIGEAPARESYLSAEKILAAAAATGAAGIHPGYGFLSENADFAEAVQQAGLIWVGAPPAAIRAMGLKDAAKALMMSAHVPVTPGYLGESQDPGRLQREASNHRLSRTHQGGCRRRRQGHAPRRREAGIRGCAGLLPARGRRGLRR
jgi:3-methylcrotonyl-CoA carboxylase alpha subunit